MKFPTLEYFRGEKCKFYYIEGSMEENSNYIIDDVMVKHD